MTMRQVVLGSLAGLVLAASSFGASFMNVNGGVWNSGVASANPTIVLVADGAVDSHYVLLPPAGSGFGSDSFVVMTGAGSPVGTVWTSGNSSSSKWIGPQGNQNNTSTMFASASVPFVYRMFFNLGVAGVLANANTTMTFAYLSDNQGSTTSNPNPASHVRMCAVTSNSDTTTVCGSQIAGSENPGGENSATLQEVTVNSGFTSGWMALDFYVYNAPITIGQNPTGLRVEFRNATGDPSIPEPGTMLLMAAGLGALALGSRRKH